MLNKTKSDIVNVLIPRVLNKHPEHNIYLMMKLLIILTPLKICNWWSYGDTGLTGKKDYS